MSTYRLKAVALLLLVGSLSVALGAGCLTGKQRPADAGVTGDGDAGDGGGCEACTPGEGQCVQDFIRFCIKDPEGCARWTAPQPCPPAKPFCSNARCEAVCDDECNEQGKRRCVTAGYQICGQHDSDKCLEWGPVLACAETELCWPATGQCLPDCNGKPCSCKSGETQPCTDVGTCKGGQRRCIDGFFGPCEWQVGPKAEICDGKDNDCNGPKDDGLVPEPCAKQQGVCEDAVKRCGGAGGWQACTTSDYEAHATANSLLYEEVEQACDNQDNDCNGDEDEPAACCQPDCTDKDCGADNGCGFPCKEGKCPAGEACVEGKCQCQPDCTSKDCGVDDGCGGKCNGPCPNNATCQAGDCVCDYIGCGAVCCAEGEACDSAGSACCTPDCAGRSCGLDPVCGASCGGCDPAKACVGAGLCGGWAKEHQDPGNTALADVTGLPKAGKPEVWAVGDGGLVIHFDGTGWQSVAGAPGAALRGAWVEPSGTLWVVGAGGTLASFDGSAWQPVDLQQSTPPELNAIWAGGETIFAVGASGVVARYDPAGAPPWTIDATVPVTDTLYDVWGNGGGTLGDVWVVGALGTTIVYQGGAWLKIASGVQKDLYAVWGSSAKDVWAVGAGGTILHYAGSSWTPVSGVPTTEDLRAVWGNAADDVWAAGAAGTLLHYDGTSWTALTPPPVTGLINGIWTASATAGWAVTQGGAVLKLDVL